MMTAIILIVAVAVLALVLRAMGGRDESVSSPPPPEGLLAGDEPEDRGGASRDAWEGDSAPEGGEEDDFEEGAWVEAAAVTSDGWAFVPVSNGIELIPPGEDEEPLHQVAAERGRDVLSQASAGAPVNPHTGRRLVHWKPGEPLAVGDLIAARVVRGGADMEPWQLEALGRDRDYRAYGFETEEAARTACDLVQARVVRMPRDEFGEPVPVTAEEFDAARRDFEETEEALALGGDEPFDDGRDDEEPGRRR